MNVLGMIRGSGWNEMEAVQYYRVFLPLREVNRADNGIKASCVSQQSVVGMSDDELGGRDVYVMARMYHVDCEEFIAEIHRRGGVLVLDTDDDLTESYKLVSGRGEEFKKVLSMVDYVTTSTLPLASEIGKYTKRPPRVLKNHVDVQWMRGVAEKSKRITKGLTMGFIGSPTHWGDWYLPAVPFSRIARDYDITPVLAGEGPRYLNYASRDLVKFAGVPFAIYPVLASQLDVVLCAVDSRDQFSVGKSGVKALETMALGNVAICSRFAPYLELADMGAPIVIVQEESRDGWYEAMEMVINSVDYRDMLCEQGPDWVLSNRDMLQSGHEKWSEFYREIAN